MGGLGMGSEVAFLFSSARGLRVEIWLRIRRWLGTLLVSAARSAGYKVDFPNGVSDKSQIIYGSKCWTYIICLS
jgi:hypothetical protein